MENKKITPEMLEKAKNASGAEELDNVAGGGCGGSKTAFTCPNCGSTEYSDENIGLVKLGRKCRACGTVFPC